MQLIAFIAQATVAKRVLDQLGLDSTGPPVARAAPPPDEVDPGLGPTLSTGVADGGSAGRGYALLRHAVDPMVTEEFLKIPDAEWEEPAPGR